MCIYVPGILGVNKIRRSRNKNWNNRTKTYILYVSSEALNYHRYYHEAISGCFVSVCFIAEVAGALYIF